MKILRFVMLILLPISAMGQITISDGTSLAVKGILATNANINNINLDNSNVNLQGAFLHLLSANPQQITTQARLKVGNLIISGGGEKTVSGEWEITNSLHLDDGLVTPTTSGKIIFAAPNESSQSITANDNSFVNGYFYSRGEGLRSFPIGYKNGNEKVRASAGLANGSARLEAGIRVANSDPLLQPTPELEEILQTRYWQIDAPEAVNSRIVLSTNGLLTLAGKALVVVQSSAVGGSPENLKGALNQAQFATSDEKVTRSIVTLGVPRVFDIKIHDLITPFHVDDANDILFIDNINLTEENTVTLLDRWGVTHRVWHNYDNANPQFDFKSLSPGNYICVVEYKLPGVVEKKKASQMITVLRTN